MVTSASLKSLRLLGNAVASNYFSDAFVLTRAQAMDRLACREP
jgi:hypothetical protein